MARLRAKGEDAEDAANAMADLYDRYSGIVYGVALRVLGDPTAAEEKVRGVLAGLPQEQRKALEMAFFEGMTHTEIARKTGDPLGTVKTRIRSALLAVRKAFA